MYDVGARVDAARGAVRGGHQLVRGGASGARHGRARRRLGRHRHGRACCHCRAFF